MEATPTEAREDLVQVTFWDWQGAKKASLAEVPVDATVGEVLDEACRAMELPADSSYQAILESRQLNLMDTLREAGVCSNVDLEIIPEVYAGNQR